MKAWCHHFKGLFTPAECAAIVAFAESQTTERAGSVGYGGGQKVVDSIRRSEVRWLNRDDKRLAAVHFKIMDAGERVNNSFFGFDLRGYRDLQFTSYRAENSGHYDWHEDLNWTGDAATCRKLSMVVLLSSPLDFDGGGLEFRRSDTPPLAQGDAIFFPSFHYHRVLPVTRGLRQTLVTWFNGPTFK